MVIIDENLPASLVSQLHKWGIRARVVGVDVAHVGIKDENLIPVLHSLKRVTFFTLDKDFYKYQLCHRSYCLVQLELPPKIAADYTRQFLNHRRSTRKTRGWAKSYASITAVLNISKLANERRALCSGPE